jgi:hypothetical protein
MELKRFKSFNENVEITDNKIINENVETEVNGFAAKWLSNILKVEKGYKVFDSEDHDTVILVDHPVMDVKVIFYINNGEIRFSWSPKNMMQVISHIRNECDMDSSLGADATVTPKLYVHNAFEFITKEEIDYNSNK